MTFVRYFLIQLLAYVVDVGGFMFLTMFVGFGPITGNLICKLVAGIFAFFSHRNFTFSSNESADKMHQAVCYFALLALNIPLSSGALWLCLLWIKEPVVAKILTDVVCVVINYQLSKSYVFATVSHGEERSMDLKGNSV